MNNVDFGAFAARHLLAGRELLRMAQKSGSEKDWDRVLAEPSFWSLRHESGISSVRNMSPLELDQSLIEDLIFTAVENGLGSATCYPVDQATRHLGRATNMAPPIMESVSRMLACGLALETSTGLLSVNHNRLQEAQEFCGVYMATEEDAGVDCIDDIVAVGGEALLGDPFSGLADDVLIQDNVPESDWT